MQNAAEPKHVYCTQDINPHLAQPWLMVIIPNKNVYVQVKIVLLFVTTFGCRSNYFIYLYR
jgi:hypothetical protein